MSTVMKKLLLSLVVLVTFWPAPVAAQLDPLLFIKRLPPNVLVAVDTGNRMQRDTSNEYRDDNIYQKDGFSWETALGLTAANSSLYYRRKFINLVHKDPASSGGDRFEADYIQGIGDLDPAYATFDAGTRINIAKTSLIEAINRNASVVRFGLLRMRQNTPQFETPVSSNTTKWKLNEGPVKVVGATPLAVLQQADSPIGGGKYSITRPVVSATNASVGATGPLVAADAVNANTTVLSRLALATGAANSLIPAGRDAKDTVDAPVDNMLDDLKTEATRLLSDPNCRNTVAILIVGGGEGTTTGEDPAAKASTFLNVTGGHRVPIYVIAIAPPAADVAQLQAIATNSGGRYTEITAAMVAAVGEGQPVPEFVRAVNQAVQHTFAEQSHFDTAPTGALPIGPYSEHQVTSPIVGTVNLVNAENIDGGALELTDIENPTTGVKVPQRANLLVTSGFRLPTFDGQLRAFRVYEPVVDASKPSGYKFVQDGTRLWVGCAPGTTTTGPCSTLTTNQRNIYTALPDGSMVTFTTDNAATLRTHLNLGTNAAAEALISFVRSQPLGAIIGSTPAIMDPPSLDPPPDSDYPGFAAANVGRRSIVWVGANDGMLHAIDARLGHEVWAYIPYNLLPKLRALQSGQPVGDFRYFVDSSPKVADVKVDGTWRTYLVIGQGPGGTFYQTFDVTLDDMANTVSAESDNLSDVLSYFDSTTAVPLKWAFPRYLTFNPAKSPWGELGGAAEEPTAVERSVGETWSDPAVGQIESGSGKYVVLTGSGFYKYSLQVSARSDTVAGNTFYMLDVKTGAVLDSRSVGSDGVAEDVDDCHTAGNCRRFKNALQADPVATGPPDSRFITKAYIGDLDGKIWRFDIGLDAAGAPKIKALVSLLTTSAQYPFFTSMATVTIGSTKQYLFQGAGSDLLPSTGVNDAYKLFVVLDNGATGTKTAEVSLETVNGAAGDEKVSGFPAVAGDIVFFATTTYKPTIYCGPNMDGNLYAFTFIGGPAYDTNNDGTVSSGGKNLAADSTKVRTASGARATSPFIVDQHLVFGAGGNIEMFGDPEDFNNGVGQVGVRILSWREVR